VDYLATGKLISGTAETIISGIADGCVEAGCALIGGETAEMPGFYKKGEYDLAGFVVGAVDPKIANKVLDAVEKRLIKPGDQLIGIASSGLHSNGYSLARELFFKTLKWKIDRYVGDFHQTLGEEFMVPTRIYVKAILGLLNIFQLMVLPI